MLTARGKASAGATLGTVALVAAVGLGFSTGTAAGSDPSSDPSTGIPVDCVQWDPVALTCLLTASKPGSSPSTTASTSQPSGSTKSGDPVCYFHSQIVACSDSALGWFDASTSCYYKLADPQPPPTDQIWNGHPAGGAIYKTTCFNLTTLRSQPVLAPGDPTWLQNPPPGDPQITPGQVAEMAVAKLVMHGPTVAVA